MSEAKRPETSRPATSRPASGRPETSQSVRADDPLAVATVEAIRAGDLDTLGRLLAEHRGLATVRLVDPNGESRTLLHVVTDWPGHFPRAPETVAVLVAAGADVNARFVGPHTETPLHWAASSDDVPTLDALLDAGADIEAGGSVIAAGTAMTDATVFGQWQAARRLVERGARTTLWESAALGLADRVEGHLSTEPPPPAGDITAAFWAACHGGRLVTAEYLLDRGAELNWVSSWDGLTPLDAARRSEADDVVEWLLARGARSAGELAAG